MLATPAVRNLVRDGKIYQLPNLIHTHTREGMQLLDQALLALYQEKLITRETVLAFCNDNEQVERRIASKDEQTDSPANGDISVNMDAVESWSPSAEQAQRMTSFLSQTNK